MIRLIEYGNIFYVSPAHSEIFCFFERKARGNLLKLFHKYNLGVHIGVYKPYNWV